MFSNCRTVADEVRPAEVVLQAGQNATCDLVRRKAFEDEFQLEA